MAIEWYVRQGDEVQGPVSSSRLKQMADQEEITPETPVKEGTQGPWVAAGTVEGLFTAGGPVRRRPRPSQQPAPAPAATPTAHQGEPATTARQPGGPAQPVPPGQQPLQPAAAASAEQPASRHPGEETPCWYIQTADGRRYGPATRSQLDEWVGQRRLDSTCLVWCHGWDRWKWAAAVYPQLAQPAPKPSDGTPAQQQPAAPGSHAAAAGPSGQHPLTVQMSAAATAGHLRGPAPSAPESLVGQTLGRYEILGLLGRGQVGTVYKARQPTLDRLMAFRVLPGTQDFHFLERFRNELGAAAALTHPNIVEVHDVGQDRGHTYIAMELVEGGSMADVLRRRGRLDVGPALETMKQVAAALAEAHAKGVIHRDVKPSNILLDQKGRAKVADFGLTAYAQTDPSAAQRARVPGAALYAAPDTLRGQVPDARSDLYSVGATFYHLLAGRPVFEGQTGADVARQHVQARPRPLAEVAPGVPPSLCQVVDRLLAKDPAGRYQNAADLLAALGKVKVPLSVPQGALKPVAGEPLPPLNDHTKPPQRPWLRLAALLGGLLGLAIAALVLVLVFSRGCGPSEPDGQPQDEPSAPAPVEPGG